MEAIAVLIADEHPALREGISLRLSELADFGSVESVTTASAVEDAVRAHRPDVVVMDAQLGERAGVPLVGRIRELDPSSPAVVVLTHDRDVDAVLESLRLGASALVAKDAPMLDLVSAIRWACRGEMWISPSLLSIVLAAKATERGPMGRRPRPGNLTEREIEILELLAQGLDLRELASRLNIAVSTARTHTHNIQMKLNVHSNVAAVSVALAKGIGLR